jgi:hypothetical protein
MALGIKPDTTFEEFIAAYSPMKMDPDDPRTHEMYDEAIALGKAHDALTVPAYPSWCDLEPGHAYFDDILGKPEDQTFHRDHYRHFGVCVQLQQTEHNKAGNVWTTETNIWVDRKPGPEELDSQSAREIGENLIDAARLYDEVTGAASAGPDGVMDVLARMLAENPTGRGTAGLAIDLADKAGADMSGLPSLESRWTDEQWADKVVAWTREHGWYDKAAAQIESYRVALAGAEISTTD